MILEVIVVPNSKRFAISRKDGKIKVHLRSPPENNKANMELVKELSSLLGCDVSLISGHTSKRKKLSIAASEQELNTLLGQSSL